MHCRHHHKAAKAKKRRRHASRSASPASQRHGEAVAAAAVVAGGGTAAAATANGVPAGDVGVLVGGELGADAAAEEADVDLESYDPSQYDWDAFLTQ